MSTSTALEVHVLNNENPIRQHQLQDETRGMMEGENQQHQNRFRFPLKFDDRLYADPHRVNADATEYAVSKDLSVFSAHPETLRIIAYVLFWLMIFLCLITTHLYVDPSLIEDNLLTKTIGYRNICVYFDFPPSRYVAAMMFPIVLIFYYGYLFLNWIRMRKASLLGIVSKRYANFFEALIIIEVFFITWTQVVFVVDVNTSVFFHTLAFLSLQLGLILNAFNSFAYYTQVISYTKVQLYLAITYIVLFVVITFVKNIFTQSAINGTPVLDYGNPTHVLIARAFDVLWMLVAAVMPIIIAYLLRKESSRLSFTF